MDRSRRLKTSVAMIAAALLAVYCIFFASSYSQFVASTVLVFVIAAIGQEWLIGRAGQFSLGGAAFLLIGSYSAALIGKVPVLGVFPIPLIISGLAGAVVGLLVGMPAARLRGLYLLLATLALHFIATFAAVRYDRGHPGGLLPRPAYLGGHLLEPGRDTVILGLVLLAGVIVFIRNLLSYAPGRAWTALRESEPGAASAGIPTTRWKLVAFVGSSSVTALAGGLLAYVNGVVTADSYPLSVALMLIVIVFFGGLGSITGVVTSAIVLSLLPTWLQDLSASVPGGSSGWFGSNLGFIQGGLYGLLLLLGLLFEPGGLAAVGRRLWAFGERRMAGGRRDTRSAVDGPGSSREGRGGDRPVLEVVPSAAEGSAGAVPHPPGRPVPRVAVEHLRVQYANGALGVEDLSFEIAPGEILAIVGRNGAGKTSAVRGIVGFPPGERVTVSGRVLLEGRDISRLDAVAVSRQGIALVPERQKVFPGLTVAEHFRAAGLDRTALDNCFASFPALAESSSRPAGLLSGGQRQLLALAVAAARAPRVLVVDEMSLGLAPVAIASLTEDLRRIREDTGLSMVLVDQSVAVVERIADRILVLEHGAVVQTAHVTEFGEADLRAAIMGV